ncbi:MAG: VCBS repeat-containing protein, partial [Magnetococcales bacterium]|nr:VCBS repeat-containing protein [Magnetococcales bacterium]
GKISITKIGSKKLKKESHFKVGVVATDGVNTSTEVLYSIEVIKLKGKKEKGTICHKPGTPAEKTMNVPSSALKGHLGHGDTIGKCQKEGHTKKGLSIKIDNVKVIEGNSAKFTVTLSKPSNKKVSVKYHAQGETAYEDEDFSYVSGKLIFRKGETEKNISVPTVKDNVDEFDETFFIKLEKPHRARLAKKRGKGTIIDQSNGDGEHDGEIGGEIGQENSLPVANDGSFTIDENTVLTGTLNASDSDGDQLTFTIKSNGVIGTENITDTSTGSFTYTPNPNVSGSDFFTFTANDGQGNSNTATISVTINKVNDAPSVNIVGKVNMTGINQGLAPSGTTNGALGDLDNDGDLDAFIPRFGPSDRIYMNEGTGKFTDSGQRVGTASGFTHATWAVALGDLDNDGDLDVFVGMTTGSAAAPRPNHILLNNGDGTFQDSGQVLGVDKTAAVALEDVDGDGDLDALVLNQGASRVLLNNGSGLFTDTGQSLPSGGGISVGDVDGDGDSDFVIASGSTRTDKLFLNDGKGTFTDSGQSFNVYHGTYALNYSSEDVKLGDLDGDGDLDIFMGINSNANISVGSRVWINNGSGQFTSTGQQLGNPSYRLDIRGMDLGDLDGDGDLDVIFTHYLGSRQPDWILLNDGLGHFSDGGFLPNTHSNSSSIALADLDNDGDLDGFVFVYGDTDYVWINNSTGTLTSLTYTASETVKLSGGATDRDGVVVSYSWTQLSGTSVTLSGADTGTAKFTAPNVSTVEILKFRLSATDELGAIGTADIEVTINPAIM